MTGIREEKEGKDFKSALHSEMEKRIRIREPANFLSQHITVDGGAIDIFNLFLQDCIEDKDGPSVMGVGRKNSKNFTKLLNRYLTGNSDFVAFSLINKENNKHVDDKQKSVVAELLSNPNKKYQLLYVDDQKKWKAVKSLAYNEYYKNWKMPLIITNDCV